VSAYPDDMSGRFLLFGSLLLVALIGGAIAFGFLTSGEQVGPVASLEQVEERDVIHFEDDRVYLVYNDGDPLALSDDSQHLGDRVTFCESSQMFYSKAHGEIFDIRGVYFGGPATRGLARYPVTQEGDLLYVDTEREIEGPPRGEPKALEPAGDFCL